MIIKEIKAKSIITKSNIPGADYVINPLSKIHKIFFKATYFAFSCVYSNPGPVAK